MRFHDGRGEELAADASPGGTGADPMAFPHDYHLGVWRDFLDAIDSGRPPRISGAEALKVHRLIDALLAAGTTGRAVAVKESREEDPATPFIEKAGGGAILNITSISGYRASARTIPYAAVKAAVINYTMSQGLVLAPKKIRVNAIAPGSIEFPGGMWDKRKTSDPQLYNSILRAIPWGRLGRPEEVANAALFLCSDAASWVTGQTLTVDGGQMLR